MILQCSILIKIYLLVNLLSEIFNEQWDTKGYSSDNSTWKNRQRSFSKETISCRDVFIRNAQFWRFCFCAVSVLDVTYRVGLIGVGLIFDCFLGVAIPCMSRILECFPNFSEYFELFCVLLPWPALFWFFYFFLKS